MPNFDEKNIWDTYISPPITFGWVGLLSEWNESLLMPHQIKVLIDNLQAASDWSSDYQNIPLDHFLRYLNFEKEAIQWFIYEVIAMRWMWGESRLDYVAYLINQRPDLIHLESTFEAFPGSPNDTQTLRQFLTAHLNEEELTYVNMPPPLRNPTYPPAGPSKMNITISFSKNGDVASRCISSSNASSQMDDEDDLPRLVQPRPIVVKKKPVHSPILFRFCKKRAPGNSKTDELMWLHKIGENEYTFVYNDKKGTQKHTVKNLTRIGVHRYLSTTFRMMHMDTDPYEAIQIEFPHLPVIIVNTKMRSEDRDLIYDALYLTFDSWPVHSV